MTPVKCLIVDDREDNLLVLKALLEADDVEILMAQSGVEALELLLVHDVALALLDVQMPEMDGFELAELMRGRRKTRHVPVIFVTAGARDQYRLFKGYDAGAVDFLFKPIEPAILRNKAGVFFELYRQRQQIKQELKERTETLRLNEMFAAVLGHDLRSPLGAIVSSAQALPHLSADPRIHDVARRILSSGTRMTHLINDLLDMTRARLGGGLAVQPEPADLADIVQRVVVEQRAQHPGRIIDVLRLGRFDGRWDPNRLAQVLANLVGNALQHGTADTPVVVTLDGRAADIVTFAVANGGDIDGDLLANLFEPFRSRDAGGRSGGLGLGLYIARQLVVAHRGDLQATADDGRVTLHGRMPRNVEDHVIAAPVEPMDASAPEGLSP